jgi:glucosamine--fructose-6-phosphate aminotransferase (isomerizing)
MTATSVTSPYLSDILEQPDRLRGLTVSRPWEALAPLAARAASYDRIVLTGMGASLFALWPAWLTIVRAGRPAWLIETGELVHSADELLTKGTLIIAASQSGRSAEIVSLAERAEKSGTLIGITNDTTSPLAQIAELTIPIDAGQEHAVSTRSYVNTLAVGSQAADLLAGEPPSPQTLDAAADAIAEYLESWRARTDAFTYVVGLPERLFLVGRGASLAAAHCGALIIKEAAKWPAEAMSSGQFRHGPLELADPRLVAVILAGETGADQERNLRLQADVNRYGGRAVWANATPRNRAATMEIAPGDGVTRAIAEIVALQLLSIAVAEQSGVEPGVFRHLEKVTTVE